MQVFNSCKINYVILNNEAILNYWRQKTEVRKQNLFSMYFRFMKNIFFNFKTRIIFLINFFFMHKPPLEIRLNF